MRGEFTFQGGIDGDAQQSSFQNATLSSLGEDERSISIAITPCFPESVDVLNENAVHSYLEKMMQPLLEAGFDVDIQYGPFEGE